MNNKRGRLKIFLGAAPGVGKTYAMLEAAHERLRENIDVVAGIIETHGRKETLQLLKGIIQVSPLEIEYRGRVFREMNLDGLLERRPQIALVDELAHSNIPSSRHAKRWQDVEELLVAGIDVYATLNIQHLESLNDIVEKISGIKVKETLPDNILSGADEIELIDLSPQDLLKRLQEGKVYIPEQAQKAVQNFFTPGNLTALREMALRYAALRVDRQMQDIMRANAIPGPWPTRERILVYLSSTGDNESLVRAAKRFSQSANADFIVVTVETPHPIDESEQKEIDLALRLAEQLGGEVATLHGDEEIKEIISFARERNVTQIMLKQEKKPGWLKKNTAIDEWITKAEGINIILVAGRERTTPTPGYSFTHKPGIKDWYNTALALTATFIMTGIGHLIDIYGLPTANISLTYLLAVLVVAIKGGLRAAIITSLTSFLAFNFFFTEPRYALVISDTHNILTVILFLIAAIIVSNLAARPRQQMSIMRENSRITTNLYDFSRKITAAATLDDVLWAVVHHVAATINGKSLVLLNEENGLRIRAGYPPEDHLDDRSQAAADWAWKNMQMAGRGSATLPASDWLFLPLKTVHGGIGVLGIQMPDNSLQLSSKQLRLLESLAAQTAVAIERTNLVAGIEAARLGTERERLRSALLSSLSHDLRTPLVSIMGATSSILSLDNILAPENRRELLQTIQDEAERLNRFVQNLLDMTRLESGALQPRKDWVDLGDLARAALNRSRKLTAQHQVNIDIEKEVPLLYVDQLLIEQVLFNLIDNASKYAPSGTVIKIWAKKLGENISIEICDQGPGISEADREKIFDMFYRIKESDGQTAGTGLGLAICRGIITAHNGTIKAESGLNGSGTCIVIHLPYAHPPAFNED